MIPAHRVNYAGTKEADPAHHLRRHAARIKRYLSNTNRIRKTEDGDDHHEARADRYQGMRPQSRSALQPLTLQPKHRAAEECDADAD